MALANDDALLVGVAGTALEVVGAGIIGIGGADVEYELARAGSRLA